MHFFFLILDGRPQWEVEAKIIREKSQGVSIFIPSDSLSFNRNLLNDVTCFFAVMRRGGGASLPQQDGGLGCAGAVLCLQWQKEKEPIPAFHVPLR